MLGYGFAFGPGGDRLQGKSLLLSFTTGGSLQDYSAEGKHRHPVETFLLPLELQFSYCGFDYLPPVYSLAMSASTDKDIPMIEQRAVEHAEKLKQRIVNFLTGNRPEHFLMDGNRACA